MTDEISAQPLLEYRTVLRFLAAALFLSSTAACTAILPTVISDDDLATQVAATIYAEQTAGSSTPYGPATVTIEHGDASFPTSTATALPTPSIPVEGVPLPPDLEVITPENASELVQVAVWGKGWITTWPAGSSHAQFSPDSTVFALATSRGVYLYDSHTLEELHFWRTASPARTMAFSPQGDALAAGIDPQTVQVFDLNDWSAEPPAQAWDFVDHVAFTDDGSQILTISGGQVQWFERGDQDPHDWADFFDQRNGDTRLSPSGNLLTSIHNDYGFVPGEEDPSNIQVWDLTRQELLLTIPGRVMRAAISPDDTLLAFSAMDGFQVWDIANQALIAESEHRLFGTDMRFSADGSCLFLPDEEGGLWRWDWETGNLEQVVSGLDVIREITLSPDGRSLIAITMDYRVWVIDTNNWELRGPLEDFAEPPTSIAFRADGQEWVTLHLIDKVLGRRMPDGTIEQVVTFPYLYPGALSHDAGLVAGAEHGTVRLWRYPQGTLVRQFTHFQQSSRGQTEVRVTAIGFSPTSETLAVGTEDGAVWLWQIWDGKRITVLEQPGGAVTSFAFSLDGDILAAGGEDGLIRIWSLVSHDLLYNLAGQAGGIRQLAISPDGKLLASTSSDGDVALWSMTDGTRMHTPLDEKIYETEGTTQTEPQPVRGVVFSSDGRILITWTDSPGEVRLWQVEDWLHLTTLRADGEWSGVSLVALTPDERTLIVALDDGSLHLWGVR
jgi:WD40 repeat protein